MAQTTYNLSVNMGDGNANSGNMTGCFNTNVYKYDEDAQIMLWLSPLEPNIRHQGVRNDRFDGVGDWLLETGEFREWRECEGGAYKAILFCSGNPGVGKTYLSSLVIDSLYEGEGKEGMIVACLYCDFLAQGDQTITNMMGAILKQLVGGGEIPNFLREAFQEAKNRFGGRVSRLPELMRMMRIAIASLPQLFICIDALDECLPKHLPDLLKSLRDIVRESPRTRIFLTGRPHVREEIQRCFGSVIVIPISPNTDDIKNYLEMRLDNDAEPDAMNDDLRRDIIRIISERISDIFLLVSLNIDAILGGVTIRQRRKKLEEMTRGTGLGAAYTATLNRVRAQKGDKSILGLKVLMWVLYSERPLRAVELCHALGVEVGSTDLDPENIPTIRTLLSSSQGLVVVEASSSTVRLVHYTLKEHLSSDPTLFHNHHATIAEVCLTYLNFRSVRDLSPTLDSAPSTTPFLGYCSYYWGDHTTKGMTESVKTLALKLLHGFDKHISAQLILLRYTHRSRCCPAFDPAGGPAGFTGLHGVAFLGVVGIVGSILETREWDANATDITGSTALAWAAARGHDKVVKMLLEWEGVNPDLADTRYGQSPLSLAAECGHDGVVKMLLEQADVNPNKLDIRYDWTPLSRAAMWGHEVIVKMLLARADVNPDQAGSKYGRTPLSYAAARGHEGVVKMLLERVDVNSDAVDTLHGQTPLSWAAESGHDGVVKMLLERADVNPNKADIKYGRTPLSWAASWGHVRVVKMLLERADVNPDEADTLCGQTPLSWAAGFACEGVLKMLLERADVNPNKVDIQYGRTPLSWAAREGHKVVVEILLARADVNPDAADTSHGRTPLSWAAGRGYVGIVKLLLERKGVRTTTSDNENKTPLCWALSEGHEEIARILQERENINSDTTDSAGQAPPPPSARHEDESPAEIQFQSRNPNTDTTDLPPADPGEQDGIPDINDLALDRYIIIASLICLLAILTYIVPFSSPDLSSLHR